MTLNVKEKEDVKQAKRNTICLMIYISVFFVLFINVAGNSEETWNMKPKSDLADTIRHTERPGREQDLQPDRIIKLAGVQAGDTVCDIGAGTGFFTFRLAKVVGDTGKVYAVDIDQEKINYMRNKMEQRGIKNIVLVTSEETDPKLPPSSCDKVLIVNTYYRFWAPVTIMKNVKTALKPEGVVAIIDHKKDKATPGPAYELRADKDDVLLQMGEAGYQFSRSYDFLERYYFLVFQTRK